MYGYKAFYVLEAQMLLGVRPAFLYGIATREALPMEEGGMGEK